MRKVLVVDDEASIRSSLSLLLKSNFQVCTASDGQEALEVFDSESPDIVLLDLMMPRLDGIETLKQLREKNHSLPVIMLSAANTVKSAVEAMKLGALDYLNKPFDVEELTSLIIQTLDSAQSGVPTIAGRQNSHGVTGSNSGRLVGQSVVMNELYDRIDQVAGNDTTILISGESGTGKELVARRIHDLSKRKNKPFVAINCAAIPETLIESELFGHEKGAFTSAVEKRIGHFELAHGGTLFLDEIGELSLPVQVKMLRFLQEQEFFRVGQSVATQVDVRILAATNRDLESLVKEQKFRQDLFYRIHVIHLELPPLRERFQDIPLLIEHFLEKFSDSYGDRKISFSPEALDILREYEWPGNVRELENVMESLLALAPEDQILPEYLPARLKSKKNISPVQLNVFDGSMTFEEAEKKFEMEMIVKALKRTNYVQTRAAELLGISRRILKYKMDKLGISQEEQLTETGEESVAAVDGGAD